MHWLDYTVIGVYMLGVAGIGVWTSRMIRGTEDYFLGGRSFGKVFTIFLQFGTGTSSISDRIIRSPNPPGTSFE